jgi:cyclic-di-AMP phosphodiesterase PgpH
VSSFLAADLFFGLLGGLFSAGLAFVLLPILESLFSIVTSTRLLDLTNSDLPIFRRMAIAAPGTYHHSLIVATIAEKAAEEIRLDPMLVKAGALYHDIGKLKMPEYFIENKTLDSDAHRDLTPAMSTLVIVNHVKEGAEMGRRLKLPWKVREIIEQHHGNSLVRYFFQKAKEQYNPGDHKINEESFRYPGRPPRSKEAALVMIADSVEAAARSLKLPKRETLKKVITDIINAYLQDGQLDDCDFSLRELRTVASSLQSILFAVYHPRVSYPGFDFEKKNDHRRQPSA